MHQASRTSFRFRAAFELFAIPVLPAPSAKYTPNMLCGNGSLEFFLYSLFPSYP